MRVVQEPDLVAFAELTLPHLLADPVGNNVACGVLQNRRDGILPVESDALWLCVRDSNGKLAGAALSTPPYGLLLTEMPPAAVDALASHLAAAAVRLPGVNGPIALASRFAEQYAELVGVTAEPVMSLRMFRLDAVAPPDGVPGQLREARRADRDLLVDWAMAFSAEALPHQARRAESGDAAARPVDVRLAQPGLLWLWEVDGEAVSTAYLSTPAAGVVRVSGVYTPPVHRGRGYASACVAGISQHALDSGALACMLYTDLANSTSNKIYQAIGYRPVADTQEWRFR